MHGLITYTGILGVFTGKAWRMAYKKYTVNVNLTVGDNVIATTLTRKPRHIEVLNSDNAVITGDVATGYDIDGSFYRILINTTVALNDITINVMAW